MNINDWKNFIPLDKSWSIRLGFYKKEEVQFTNPDCVNKTWPQFWEFIDFLKGVVWLARFRKVFQNMAGGYVKDKRKSKA